MKLWTMLFSLAVACLVAANAPAQGKFWRAPAKKHPLLERFEKMDTNHDGILTAQEFAAAHPRLVRQRPAQFTISWPPWAAPLRRAAWQG